jgi:hypothetical protein
VAGPSPHAHGEYCHNTECVPENLCHNVMQKADITATHTCTFSHRLPHTSRDTDSYPYQQSPVPCTVGARGTCATKHCGNGGPGDVTYVDEPSRNKLPQPTADRITPDGTADRNTRTLQGGRSPHALHRPANSVFLEHVDGYGSQPAGRLCTWGVQLRDQTMANSSTINTRVCRMWSSA